MPPRVHVLARFFLDFMINAVARSIIRGTVPIMLCVEGPLDFVKDVTAVFFILKLDDIDSDKDLSDEKVWDFTDPENDYEIEDMTDPAYRVAYLKYKVKLAKPSDVKKIHSPEEFRTQRRPRRKCDGQIVTLTKCLPTGRGRYSAEV